jgi:hypothetical protein
MPRSPSRPFRLAAVLAAGALALSGCGGGDEVSDDTATVSTDDGADGAVAADPTDEPSDEAPADGGLVVPIPPAVLAGAFDVVDLDTADGGRVVAAMTCANGAAILQVGFAGIPNGTYEGVVEPSAGGDVTVAVQGDNGTGLQARQGSFDEAPAYTVTYADLDGLSFTIAGCPAP